MNQVRLVVIVLTFPIWLPLKVLVQLGIWMEDVLIFLDDLLDSILDVTIPQLKDKRRKNMKNKELNS